MMAKIVVALTLAITMGATGDILLSIGMRSNGEVNLRRAGELPRLLRIVFTNIYVLLGVCAMAVYFGSYITALAWVDVSVANPLTALSYLIATAYAALVLREKISPQRALGLVLIVLGAIFVGVSS
jgi:drug/metabolite transporter (DMT)-like permease